MRPITLFTTLLASVTTVSAYWKGFNIGANNPDGSCKSRADWETAFRTIQSFPGYFSSARLFASSDCNTLANAVPAALATGSQILVGVWTEDEGHFQREKDALEAAIRQYGSSWIVAISVGSEDLYRKDTSADRLAQQIYDVRGMVRAMGVQQEVGHVDTWTAWVDPANEAVIRAVDFVGTDGYPYWQGAPIWEGSNVFWKSVQDVRDVVNRVKPGTWVWITETGWPVRGDNFGSATPSVENAAVYWKYIACAAFQQAHTFWYAYQDYNDNPSFGVVDANRKPLYDLSC